MNTTADNETIRLTNATIVDATSQAGADGQTITVTAGRIRRIDPSDDRDLSAEGGVIDLAGGFVVPAFWDVHCHPGTGGPRDLQADLGRRCERIRDNVRRCRTHGVTGIRALGEALYADVMVRDDMVSSGPSLPLYVAGPALKPPGGHGATALGDLAPAGSLSDAWGSLECVGPEGFGSTALEMIAERRLDWVKVFVSGGIAGDRESHTDTHMTRDEIEAVCRVAHRNGVQVAAHAGNPEAIEMAVLAGVDSIEHGYEMTPENATLLADRGVWYVPTLSITHNVNRMALMSWSRASIAKASALAPVHRDSVRYARDAGVRMASGSDMRPLGMAGIEEVTLLADECLTPAESLRIATLDSAELCGAAADHGTVEVGKWANLMVTRADPSEDIRTILHPTAVLHRGLPQDGGDPDSADI